MVYKITNRRACMTLEYGRPDTMFGFVEISVLDYFAIYSQYKYTIQEINKLHTTYFIYTVSIIFTIALILSNINNVYIVIFFK